MNTALVAVALVALSAFVAGVLLYRIGKRTQRGEDVSRETKDVAVSQEVEHDVDRMADADVDERLREWTRK